MRLSRILEIVANCILIFVCVIVAIQYVPRVFGGKVGKSNPPHSRPDLIGKSLADLRPDKDSGGVLLVVSASCPFCERSLPFYRTLTPLLKELGLSALLTVTGNGPHASGDDYIRSRDLSDVRAVASLKLESLNVHATPTLLLYDSSGRITGTWVGLLSKTRQDDLRNAVKVVARK